MDVGSWEHSLAWEYWEALRDAGIVMPNPDEVELAYYESMNGGGVLVGSVKDTARNAAK